MAYVDDRADRALTGIEISPDGIESGVFHDHDHHGSREHRRQDRVLESVRKMLGLDEEAERAFGSKGYLLHGLPSKGRGYERGGPNALGFATPARLDHHYDGWLGIDGLRRPQGSAEPPQHRR
jgi:hypothetical protein